MKLKKYDKFLNEEWREKLPYEYEYEVEGSDDSTDFPYALAKSVNNSIGLKSAKGHGSNYSIKFSFTMNNDVSFKYTCLWDENNEHSNVDSDGVYDEYIEFNDKRIDIHETDKSIYGNGYDMAGQMSDGFKNLLKKIGAIKYYSAIVNVEGYVMHVETFNTKEKADAAAESWSIEVVEGKHTQGKSLGNSSLED